MVHRDFKPENVLVTKDFILKVADFGLVRDLTRIDTVSTVGTDLYMSPELLVPYGQNAQVTCQSDIYAVGLICWEIVERRCDDGVTMLWEMRNQNLKLKPPCCDDPLKSIIMGFFTDNTVDGAIGGSLFSTF
ncbi:unnamed protein product, partial [Mesorhabditis belari]|uniref:Protein kinase domain-containing protein n=1 Tax=Mesorhabditis belari TaxID=2138241 RepID=A0AAF3F8I1_9BILA